MDSSQLITHVLLGDGHVWTDLSGRRSGPSCPAWSAMYFSYGIPQCLEVGDASSADSLVDALYTDDHLLVIFPSRVQAWSSGQHRIKLGEVQVAPGDLDSEGPYVAAAWCQARHRLALVVRGRWHALAGAQPGSAG